jgi:hypothetical protein
MDLENVSQESNSILELLDNLQHQEEEKSNLVVLRIFLTIHLSTKLKKKEPYYFQGELNLYFNLGGCALRRILKLKRAIENSGSRNKSESETDDEYENDEAVEEKNEEKSQIESEIVYNFLRSLEASLYKESIKDTHTFEVPIKSFHLSIYLKGKHRNSITFEVNSI